MNDVALWLESRALRSLHRLYDVSAAEGDITFTALWQVC